MCHQTLGLVQAELEYQKIPTVSITLLPKITQSMGLKSVLHVNSALGYPLGEPSNVGIQMRILKKMLETAQIPIHQKTHIVNFDE